MATLRRQRDGRDSGTSPTAGVEVSYPPGANSGLQTATTVDRLPQREGAIIYSHHGTVKSSRLAVPPQVPFSQYQTRTVGPIAHAYTRRWWWRYPINDPNVVGSGQRPVRATADQQPSGVQQSPMRRLLSTGRIPTYNTSPPQFTPTGPGN